VSDIKARTFYPRSGIRYPNNQCLNCPYLGLCLHQKQLVQENLTGLKSSRSMDKVRAEQVLDRIDEILRWEQRVDQQKDQKFAELALELAKVARSQG
jgi:hypothetical protein